MDDGQAKPVKNMGRPTTTSRNVKQSPQKSTLTYRTINRQRLWVDLLTHVTSMHAGGRLEKSRGEHWHTSPPSAWPGRHCSRGPQSPSAPHGWTIYCRPTGRWVSQHSGGRQRQTDTSQGLTGGQHWRGADAAVRPTSQVFCEGDLVWEALLQRLPIPEVRCYVSPIDNLALVGPLEGRAGASKPLRTP